MQAFSICLRSPGTFSFSNGDTILSIPDSITVPNIEGSEAPFNLLEQTCQLGFVMLKYVARWLIVVPKKRVDMWKHRDCRLNEGNKYNVCSWIWNNYCKATMIWQLFLCMN